MSEVENLPTALGDLLRDVLPHSAVIRHRVTLSEHGLDSMAATRLWIEVQARFGVDVPPEWLATEATPDSLLARIDAHLHNARNPPVAANRPVVRADPASRYRPFPLTPIQESYVMGGQAGFTADAVGCRQYLEFEVLDLDIERLRRAWQRLVDHHDMLRVVLTPDGKQSVQPDASPVSIAVHDFTLLPPTQAAAGVAELRRCLTCVPQVEGSRPPFTIDASLLPNGAGLVHLSVDMMLTDAHGLALLLEQWRACYDQPDYQLPQPAHSARECVIALHEQRGTSAYQADLAYWLEALRDLPPGPPLVSVQPGPAGFIRRTMEGTLPRDGWNAVRSRAAVLDVSPSTLVFTLFAQALRRITGRLEVSLVMTTSMRPWLPPDTEHLVGPFTSSAVIVAGDPVWPLEAAARQLQRRIWEALHHPTVSGVTALRQLRSADRTRSVGPLPVVFTSLLGTGPGGRQDGGFGRDLTFGLCCTSDVGLEHQMWEHGGDLRYRWDVTPERFPCGALETAFAAFENALRTCVADPSALASSPLNDLQQAYYVARTTEQPVPWNGCQIYESFDLDFFEPRRLEQALVRQIAAHDALRSILTPDGTLSTSQTVPECWNIPIIDLDTESDPAAARASLREGMVGQPFPLGSWPPFDIRVTCLGRRATVHCAFDLAVIDARGIHLLCRELLRLYANPEETIRPDLPLNQRRQLHVGRISRSADAPLGSYWEERVARLPPGPTLPLAGSTASDRRRIRLEADRLDWRPLAKLGADHHLAPDMILLAAFLDVLTRNLDGRPFAIPVVCFPASREPDSTGEFTALSWVEASSEGTLLERATAYQRQTAADLRVGDSSGLAALRRRVMQERRRGSFAFPIVYTSVVDLSGAPLPAGVSQGPWLSCTPDVSLDCIGIREGDQLFACWDAVEEDFAPGRLAAMFDAYLLLLRQLVHGGAAEQRPDQPPPLETERERIIYGWNQTTVSFPTDRLLHQLIEDRAGERPDAVALRGRGWTRTYAELNQEANQIARRLRAEGVGPHSIAGICIPRGPAMVAACLGVLKAGGAYLPVEPSLPPERAALLLAEAGATGLLTAAASPRWSVPAATTVINVDGGPAAAPGAGEAILANSDLTVDPNSTAYVIFTSGSTGKPKGVAVTHRAVLNLLHWCKRTFDFGPGDLGLGVTSLGFDLSVFDIFGLLGAGGALYLADETEQRDPQLLLDILLTAPITFWNSAPTSLNQLTPLLPGVRGQPGTDALRLVFLSGDYTPLSLPADVRTVFPHARIVSLGGATEATVWSNYFIVEEIDPDWRSIPYGRPIDNARYHVLDAQLEPCPVGQEGDLYIGGECLSQGYYRRPDLTAERFIPDPFARAPGERLYRTGDRASYFADGNLCFLGRVDGQVKIRGFRIELGEIEHWLRQHPGIKDAVVAVRTVPSGDKTIVAYLVAAHQPQPAIEDLRTYAAGVLPDYMVPNFFAFVDTFPATANGKLDRAALPWPLDDGPRLSSTSSSRLTHLEQEIASLFAEILGVERFDVNRDMWDQGATSFTVVQVSNALLARYRRRVPVSIVLNDPTAAGIARWLTTELHHTPATLEPPTAPREAAHPDPVDAFSAEERRTFKAGHWSVRPLSPDEPVIPLDTVRFADELYNWRASRRDLLADSVPYAAFCRLLSLLREVSIDGRTRRLYPSAGDTYAVQVFLHVRQGGVEGVDEGLYYYRGADHALQLIRARPEIDRSVHVYDDRPTVDAAAFELFLIGQTRGIEPIYREQTERYLSIEAGLIAQLLMLGQAACRLGLCPIGDLAFDRIRDQFGADAGHRFLLALLGGRAEQAGVVTAAGQAPPFAEPEAAARRVEIAITGLAGRYPGADDPDALWQRLAAGSLSIGPAPARTGAASRAAGAPGPSGGFLENIDSFDSLLFNISPTEAETLDPQLRLLLETVWACLENAGYTPASLRRAAGRVGVIVASMWQDYQHVGADVWRQGGEPIVSGSGSDIAHRISRYFDFQGPSLAVDAACSSSLAAIHLAVESLQRGECGAVVVGAVNLLAHPYHASVLSGLGLVAEGESAGAFDTDTSGWTPGEGVVAVLLRPAAPAGASGDLIHGIIEATAAGHTGRRSTADGLAASLTAMLATHQLSPGDISYVECAAGGASVGDAAEVAALAAVLGGPNGHVGMPFGTLKPNIGHLEAAAGLAQLTKVVLQFRHGQIAPTIAAQERNPLVPWEDLPLRLADRREEWRPASTGEPLRALINAVGADGAYAHLVVRSPPLRDPLSSHHGTQVVVLSAASRQQLETLASRIRDHLASCAQRGDIPNLADIAFTLQTGRVHLAHRLAIPCGTVAGLIDDLDSFVRRLPRTRILSGTAEQWMTGQNIDWGQFWERPARRVPLPTYPFAGQSHWIQPPPTGTPLAVPALAPPEPSNAHLTAPPTGNGHLPDLAGTEEHLLQLYAQVSGIAREELNARVPLDEYGLNSLLVKRFNALLERDFGTTSRTLLFEHRTLAEIAEQVHGRQPPASDADVAIVGIAGRYPGAGNLQQFWANLEGGLDCISPLPVERRQEGWPVDLMWGGYLDDVDTFDSLLFNVTPREADLMDPQERLFLEIVWEALDDAGYPRQRLAARHHSRVGVYVGSMYNEYPFLGVEQSLRVEPVSSGAGLADIANRVSYFFDLRGPSMTVDTLCSSSLTAIHLAVESVQRGECEVAITGGVNLSLHPNKFIEQARHNLPSTDHRCRSFGAGGDGFVPGEGVGAIVLKPLRAAVRDGDRVHAVIKATAVNHGGRTNGYMVPNPVAQADLIRDALRVAGIPAATIGYIEAHGTGTELGDPIEINGLERAFAGEKPELGQWWIGSVKSAIGHLEGAAGIAGLTKAVLQLTHRRLVPSLHAESLNPAIDWHRSPFRVVRQAIDWPPLLADTGRPQPRRAAISSFGAGGANAHVIVEEYLAAAVTTSDETNAAPGQQLIVLSARDENRLRAMAGTLADFLGRQPQPLPDIAYTLQVGREHLRERLAIVVGNLAELRERLDAFHRGTESGVIRGRAPTGGPAEPAAATASNTTAAPDLIALAHQWAGGATVDWPRPHDGRPPNLVSLPSYPFAQRRHWVPWQTTPHQPVSPLSVPVYEKRWTPDAEGPARPLADGPILCLFHHAAEAVARKLATDLGVGRVLLLRDGPDQGDGLPSFHNAASGLAALESLLGHSPSVSAWVDLCDLYRAGDDPPSSLARMSLLQRLLASHARRPLRLLHLTSGLQEPPGAAPSLAGARVAGLVRMLGAEYQRVAATTMDLDAPHSATDVVQCIVTELQRGGPPDLCYRRGVRHRLELHPATLTLQEFRCAPEHAYVITGGTRGLGALVASHLVARGARRLALLALHPLPPRDRWDDPALTAHESEAVRTVRALEDAGVTVATYGGPLTDRSEMDGFLARVRGSLGEIGGVVHCAGRLPVDRTVFHQKDLAELRSVFEPKVDGLEVLADLCARDRPAFFLLFSSVAAAFPALAAGAADYAAANSFMDLFASYQVRSGKPWFRSIEWPSWHGVGMPDPVPPAYARLGLLGLDPDQGLALLDAALSRPSAAIMLPCPGRPPGSNPTDLLDARAEPVALPAPPAPAASAHRPAVPLWLAGMFAERLGLTAAELDPDVPFGELGVESILLADLLGAIEARVGRSLEPSILLDHPTLVTLSAALAARGLGPASESIAPPAPLAGRKPAGHRQVAVIGIACRFPGAPDIDAFWSLLRAGTCAITEVPESRWDRRSLYRPYPEVGKSISRWGGFIDGIEEFDPAYFAMSDEEATCLDPAIRLLLEGAETCLADAGYAGRELWGRDVGVFVGARISDYGRRAGIRAGHAGFGSDQNFISARVAHHLNLTGPNLVIDCACSSSLVSVQLAMRSLLAGESDMALAGGVDVLLDERPYLEFSAAQALSPTGRCAVFDERADGFVPGEGCGLVLLRPLEHALRDGDRIHAVIEAVAVNNDGRTVGLTTPNPRAQSAVIRRALEQSEVPPHHIAMIEAHGTGTVLGDPIELRALTDAFCPHLTQTGSCAIGSVKSNLGHLFSAAGIAGLLKTILALEHGEIPPTLACARPNPRFDFDTSPFYPNTELRPWPADRPVRAAGVSAFGLGGTNAHLLATAFDATARAGLPPARDPQAPPVFRRRRLWLDREPPAPGVTPTRPRDGKPIASILDLEFVSNGHEHPPVDDPRRPGDHTEDSMSTNPPISSTSE